MSAVSPISLSRSRKTYEARSSAPVGDRSSDVIIRVGSAPQQSTKRSSVPVSHRSSGRQSEKYTTFIPPRESQEQVMEEEVVPRMSSPRGSRPSAKKSSPRASPHTSPATSPRGSRKSGSMQMKSSPVVGYRDTDLEMDNLESLRASARRSSARNSMESQLESQRSSRGTSAMSSPNKKSSPARQESMKKSSPRVFAKKSSLRMPEDDSIYVADDEEVKFSKGSAPARMSSKKSSPPKQESMKKSSPRTSEKKSSPRAMENSEEDVWSDDQMKSTRKSSAKMQSAKKSSKMSLPKQSAQQKGSPAAKSSMQSDRMVRQPTQTMSLLEKIINSAGIRNLISPATDSRRNVAGSPKSHGTKSGARRFIDENMRPEVELYRTVDGGISAIIGITKN